MYAAGPPARGNNPLLKRDDVGKAKETCYDLPAEGFAYGRPDALDIEGAREVTMQWVHHTPRPRPETEAPDFKALNIKAVGDKVISAKDLQHYRREAQAVTPRGPVATPRSRAPPLKPSDVVPAFAYGKKTRASTPIREVVTYRFADAQEQKLEYFYGQREQQQASERLIRKIPITRAARGHAARAKHHQGEEEEEKELFKLSKFKKVGAKVDFRGGPATEARQRRAREDGPPPPAAPAAEAA